MGNNGHYRKKFTACASPFCNGVPDVQRLRNIDVKDLGLSGSVTPEVMQAALYEAMAKSLVEDGKKVSHIKDKCALWLISMASADLLQANHDETISNKAHRRGPVKTIARIVKKASDEYGGRIEKIRDVDRSTIDAMDRDQLAALCGVAEWAFLNDITLPGGARIADFDNRFKDPTGTRYRSAKVILAIPIPEEEGRYHLSEVMITHKGFEQAIKVNRRNNLKEDSHGVYEKTRYIEERYRGVALPYDVAKKYLQFMGIVTRIHDDAAKENDLGRPLDFQKYERIRGGMAAAAKYTHSNGLTHS